MAACATAYDTSPGFALTMGILTAAVLVSAVGVEALEAAADSEGEALSADDVPADADEAAAVLTADADETAAALTAAADCEAAGAGGFRRLTKTIAMMITSTSAMAANAMSLVVGDTCDRKPD